MQRSRDLGGIADRPLVCMQTTLSTAEHKEEQMRRNLIMLILAVGSASMLEVATHAQTSESKTKVKADHGKTVTYTGCVQTGTETRTYILQNVLPVERTETTGTAGTMTTTTYALLPERTVELQEQVGHKVEVTGVLIPAGKGETKYKAKTKTKGSEEETKGEVARGPMPQLKVVAVRPLAQSCS